MSDSMKAGFSENHSHHCGDLKGIPSGVSTDISSNRWSDSELLHNYSCPRSGATLLQIAAESLSQCFLLAVCSRPGPEAMRRHPTEFS
jgi:hypothetical protein